MDLFSSSLFANKKNSNSYTNNTNTNNKTRENKIEIENNGLKSTNKYQAFQDYFEQTDQNYPYKNSNEDFVYSKDSFINHNKKALFTLYDGHGGPEAVEYVVKRFPNLLEKKLCEIEFDFDEKSDKIMNAIKNTYNDINKELRFVCSETSGTTASIVFIDNSTIYSSNVGDSKIVLYNYKTNTSKILSEDHKISNVQEKNRISDLGGKIIKGRVNGVLMVTRSLGDHIVSEHGVISEPYTEKIILNKKEDYYLIIASDGIWDVINEDSLNKFGFGNLSCKDIANKLIEESKILGSKDNISTIIIKL